MKKSAMRVRGMIPGIIFAFLACSCNLHAQSLYKTAAGIRIGGTSGASIKHSYRPYYTFEGIVGAFDGGVSVTALWEKNTRAFDERGLNWYYGVGPHLAFYNGRNYYTFGRERYYVQRDVVGFGMNGIVGLEYRLPDDIPVAFSFDLKPFIELTTNGDANFSFDPGIGVKFIIQ